MQLGDVSHSHTQHGVAMPLAGIASSPFVITVIPAALVVGNTLNMTYEHSYAGDVNVFSFQAQDRFHNVRLNNDTVHATVSTTLERFGTNLALVGLWNQKTHYYDVTFRAEQSVRVGAHYRYTVTVELEQCPTVQGNHLECRCWNSAYSGRSCSAEPAAPRSPVPYSPFRMLISQPPTPCGGRDGEEQYGQ
eukprot:SAG11_NODE_12839_length_683_cov_0.676370_1_plen_190_part_10